MSHHVPDQLLQYPQSYNNNNNHQWIIVDESSSIASPNQRTSRPTPPIPLIKVPFPPLVNPEELITRPRKAKSKAPTKPPNAFMIYRMQYVKELHAREHRLPMRSVSAAVASSWRGEPEHVVEHYEDIAKEASRIYNQKFPKPPSPQKGSGVRQPQRRRSSGMNNMSDIISQPLAGSFAQIEESQRPHHRYYTGDNVLAHNHYHNHQMHTTNVHVPFPSITETQYSSNILNRPSLRSTRPLSNSYSTTPSTFHMPSLPHVHSLTTAPFNYMDEANQNEWDFATAAHA